MVALAHHVPAAFCVIIQRNLEKKADHVGVELRMRDANAPSNDLAQLCSALRGGIMNDEAL